MYYMKNNEINQKRKGSTHDFSWGALLTANLRSPLSEGQKRGVEHATALVGLLALVTDLGLEVVPAAELLAMNPHLRENGHGGPVHEAGDALVVRQRGSLVCARFESVAVGHPAFHKTCPSPGEADDSAAVAVRVDRDRLLPALLVSERHLLGSDRESALEYQVMALLGLLGLALPLLVLRGLHVLLVTAIRLGLVVLHDRVGVVAGLDRECDVVELRCHGPLRLLRQSDHLLGGFADVLASHRFVDLHATVSFRLLGMCCYRATITRLSIHIKYSILCHKSQGAALAASWRESYENFSFLLLQNMVRAYVFNGFFCGFEQCGAARMTISSFSLAAFNYEFNQPPHGKPWGMAGGMTLCE